MRHLCFSPCTFYFSSSTLPSSILIHVCCGPCLLAVVEAVRRMGRAAALFHNPNIHPLLEFRRRLTAVQVAAERAGLELIADGRYGLREFLARTAPWERPARCAACRRMRLAETARQAAERGFEAVTTTLLASAHQDHDAVRQVGQEEAAARGLRFHYEDFRPLAARGHDEARRISLYRQQYCGCIFSEEERFAPTRLHLHRASDRGEP
ncbi:MAG: epoxyqueuosine reductase QueH [Planctomycetes bacterium]|nr:epoxyqueuosine reductase QueH [Planctomycetota bacterium]